jgi:hypothetical protein
MTKNGSRPVIVGVTGHRNLLANDAALAALVGKALRSIARANANAPLLLLSGLAEGADRLVVEAARDAFGAQFWAILPLPDALYTRDFSAAASTAEYKLLKAQALRVIDAPLMSSRRLLTDYGEPRNHQYAWIGAYIAKRAQVLVAIWDGARARGTGGTAEVVDWFLAGKTPPRYRVSRAPRLDGRKDVAKMLIHIDPRTHRLRRIAV